MPRKSPHTRCTVDGCDRPHKAHGYCLGHYQQFRRGEPIKPLLKRVYTYGGTCTVEGCSGAMKAHGLCEMHYVRSKRHGTTDFRYKPLA